jgi:HrpA-like RNA helicase
MLNNNDLIILEGETGSGKSTQLPQMLCEYYKMFEDTKEKRLPVLITQPRRLATRTVAERVAFEMEESIGGFVDYATSTHKVVSKSAKIIFKLDSVVLDELTEDQTLSNYSCLIIDEAHERTISIDVILGLVKKLLEMRKGFKVIITSASLDAQLFSDYFKTKVYKVSGRLFPVDVIYHPLNYESDIVKKIETVLKKEILLNKSEMKD